MQVLAQQEGKLCLLLPHSQASRFIYVLTEKLLMLNGTSCSKLSVRDFLEVLKSFVVFWKLSQSLKERLVLSLLNPTTFHFDYLA